MTDLFHNYITSVNLSRQFVFHKRLKKSYCVFWLVFLCFSLPFLFFETTRFLSPIGCCLYFSTHPAEQWIPQDGCAAVISATDSSHTDTHHTNVFTPQCGKDTTATFQTGSFHLLCKYLLLFPGASGFLTSCSV